MLNETTADVIAAMYNEDDAKIKEYANHMEAASIAERFVRSVELDNVESALRWIATAVKTTDGTNRYGLAQLVGMAADKIRTISRKQSAGGEP